MPCRTIKTPPVMALVCTTHLTRQHTLSYTTAIAYHPHAYQRASPPAPSFLRTTIRQHTEPISATKHYCAGGTRLPLPERVLPPC
jgi:hypothetical protein